MKYLHKQLVLSFVFTLFLLGSCNKNLTVPPSPAASKSITIREAQDYYKANSTNKENYARKDGERIGLEDIEKAIIWDKAIHKIVYGQEIIIAPLKYKKYRAPRYYNSKQPNNQGLSKYDSQIGLDETSFIYFYKDKLGSIIQESVVSIPTEEWAKNPKKRFSGHVIVSDEQMNFKGGIIFKNGEVSGGFSINNSIKGGRLSAEICGWIEQWGYNYSIDPNGNVTSGPFYISYGSIPVYCTLTIDYSPSYQLPTNAYDGTGSYYSPPPYLSEEAYFTNTFISDPTNNNINNVHNYLRCFSNNSTSTYKLTVSVDQPISGNSAAMNPVASGKHIVGHTFVTLTQINSNGETIQRTLGLYPLYGGSVANPNVPSVFGNDSEYSGGWDVQLTFQITGNEMMSIVNYIPSYTNANYDLRNRNCGNLATDILGTIGISVAPYWMNTYWYSSYNPFDPTNSTANEIRGASIGALGEQLYNTPPNRTSTKSHAGGDAPKNLGNCN